VTTLRAKNVEARTKHGTWKRGNCWYHKCYFSNKAVLFCLKFTCSTMKISIG